MVGGEGEIQKAYPEYSISRCAGQASPAAHIRQLTLGTLFQNHRCTSNKEYPRYLLVLDELTPEIICEFCFIISQNLQLRFAAVHHHHISECTCVELFFVDFSYLSLIPQSLIDALLTLCAFCSLFTGTVFSHDDKACHLSTSLSDCLSTVGISRLHNLLFTFKHILSNRIAWLHSHKFQFLTYRFPELSTPTVERTPQGLLPIFKVRPARPYQIFNRFYRISLLSMLFRTLALGAALRSLLVNASPTPSPDATVETSGFIAASPGSTSYWVSNIQRQGTVAFGASGYQIFRNVMTDCGAKGDGATDDTAALNACLAQGNRCGKGCDSSTVTPALLYFPPGMYSLMQVTYSSG
jgi:hypothetical protein